MTYAYINQVFGFFVPSSAVWGFSAVGNFPPSRTFALPVVKKMASLDDEGVYSGDTLDYEEDSDEGRGVQSDENNAEDSDFELGEVEEAELLDIPLSHIKTDRRMPEETVGWEADDTCPALQPFEGGGTVNTEAGGNDAIDFFKLFITDDLIDMFVNETNRYAQDKLARGMQGRLTKWFNTNSKFFLHSL